MTTAQQQEFIDAIENIIWTHRNFQKDYDMWDDQYCIYEDRISDAKWILELFNQIKNIAE